MGPRWNANVAAMVDSQIMLREEECALGMGPISNETAVMDIQV
jgi:hypothetical protein